MQTKEKIDNIISRLEVESAYNQEVDAPHINHNLNKIEQIQSYIQNFKGAVDTYQEEMHRINGLEQEHKLQKEFIGTIKKLKRFLKQIDDQKLFIT